MPGCLPPCQHDEFLYYVRLQASRVRAALGRNESLAAGLRVLVQPCTSGSDGTVRVEILGRAPDGESLASEADPNAYLAVRGAFDRLLVHWLTTTATTALTT